MGKNSFNDVFEGLSSSKISGLIDEWIKNERNRKIVKRRLIDGITYELLAEEFDMSVRQIKHIVTNSTNKIKEHI